MVGSFPDLAVEPEDVVHPGLLGGWLHANARLSVKGRELLISRVEDAGWSVMRAAEAAGITERTAHKWLGRYRTEGAPGLLDRSSAPSRAANRTEERRVEAIAALRRPLSAVDGREALGQIGCRRPALARKILCKCL